MPDAQMALRNFPSIFFSRLSRRPMHLST
jgi:hypothetical protein